MTLQNKRFLLILLATPALLLIPFIAMQFTSEVNWTVGDFLAMGALLVVTGCMCELVLVKVKTNKNRVLLLGFVLLALFLVWAELAVGLFGTPFAGS